MFCDNWTHPRNTNNAKRERQTKSGREREREREGGGGIQGQELGCSSSPYNYQSFWLIIWE